MPHTAAIALASWGQLYLSSGSGRGQSKPAGADLAFEAQLTQLVLHGGVIVRHDVLIALALGAIPAGRRLFPALALPQMQPAQRHDMGVDFDTSSPNA